MADTAAITIPARRYGDRQTVLEEDPQVWRRTWLLVASTDHLAHPGDVVEARYGLAPALVVRGDDGRLRGFENVCPHQGAPLCLGAHTGWDQIQCNNHQWTWDLAGRLQAVDFGAPVEPGQEIPLQPLAVETWGPLVFANFDPGAGPLADDLAALRATVEGAGLDPDGLRCRSLVQVLTGGNWKSLVDGATAVGPVPELGTRQLPNLAVRADGGAGTVTIVRARPYVSVDRAMFDVLVLEPRPAGQAPGDQRPLDVTLKKDDELPTETGVDPDLIAFARAQLTPAPPTDDLLADPDERPELVALHTWLDERQR
ncbi:MAG: Rieske (2Fe-2S) protein [Acidimicrobiales bacterium]|nr:Rieske (2Fe-2S) protein [Acidimicrobiales bacterium]MCB9371847.1 Rieske (2Fe-2S) protein [Microthrixaceae bacterium]